MGKSIGPSVGQEIATCTGMSGEVKRKLNVEAPPYPGNFDASSVNQNQTSKISQEAPITNGTDNHLTIDLDENDGLRFDGEGTANNPGLEATDVNYATEMANAFGPMNLQWGTAASDEASTHTGVKVLHNPRNLNISGDPFGFAANKTKDPWPFEPDKVIKVRPAKDPAINASAGFILRFPDADPEAVKYRTLNHLLELTDMMRSLEVQSPSKNRDDAIVAVAQAIQENLAHYALAGGSRVDLKEQGVDLTGQSGEEWLPQAWAAADAYVTAADELATKAYAGDRPGRYTEPVSARYAIDEMRKAGTPDVVDPLLDAYITMASLEHLEGISNRAAKAKAIGGNIRLFTMEFDRIAKKNTEGSYRHVDFMRQVARYLANKDLGSADKGDLDYGAQMVDGAQALAGLVSGGVAIGTTVLLNRAVRRLGGSRAARALGQRGLDGLRSLLKRPKTNSNPAPKKTPNSGSTPAWNYTEFSKDAKEYLKAIEKHTGFEISGRQFKSLALALRSKKFSRLSSTKYKQHTKLWTAKRRKEAIAEWEKQTNQKWPTYQQDVYSKSGKIWKYKGDPYDAHHIIEQKFGGPHKWWNLTPAKAGAQHQGGIHSEAITKRLFP